MPFCGPVNLKKTVIAQFRALILVGRLLIVLDQEQSSLHRLISHAPWRHKQFRPPVVSEGCHVGSRIYPGIITAIHSALAT